MTGVGMQERGRGGVMGDGQEPWRSRETATMWRWPIPLTFAQGTTQDELTLTTVHPMSPF